MNLTNLNRSHSKIRSKKNTKIYLDMYKCFHRNPYINAEIVAAKKSRKAKAIQVKEQMKKFVKKFATLKLYNIKSHYANFFGQGKKTS